MRLLILGTGWMAQEHATQFGKIEGVELIGAVDIDGARRRIFGHLWHTQSLRFA